MFNEMRRAERKLSAEEAEQLLSAGEYGVLATTGEDGYPYGVPVSYAYDSGKIYFHCAAADGLKCDNLKFNDKVSFTVVGQTEVLPAKFGTKYESAIAFGTARLVTDKKAALHKILDKYCAAYQETGTKYIDAAVDKTLIYEITIEQLTGKARKNG